MIKTNSGAQLLYHGIFWFLAVLSVVYFKERLYVDASYYTFKSINEGWFHIEHGRGVLALSQFLPLLGKLFGLPLKVLLILASLWQILFFYLLFCLFQHHFKLPAASVVLLGLSVLGNQWLFFIPMLELIWGAALGVFVMAVISTDRWKKDFWLILMLLSYWLLLTSHPLNYLIGLMILLFDLWQRGLEKKLHFSLILFFFSALFIETIGGDAYESDKIVGIDSSPILSLLEPAYFKSAVILLVSNYWHVLLLGLISSIYFLIKRKYLSAFLWPVFGTLIILAAAYRWDISSYNWYTEVVYQPLVSLGLFVFAFGIIQKLSKTSQLRWQLFFGILFAVYLVRLVYLAKPIEDRSQLLETLIQQQHSSKLAKAVVNTENMARPYHQFEWSAPVEALLLSAIDGPEATVSLVADLDMNYTEHRKLLNDSSFLFRRFERMDYRDLDQDYFRLKKGTYQRLNTERGVEGLKSRKAQISIQPAETEQIVKIPAKDTSWVKVKIKNNSSAPIPSAISSKLFLAAHWFHADTMYRWDGARTPLLVDVRDSLTQDLRLWAPEIRGIYEVQFDMVKEGEFWLGLRQRYTVQVY